MLSAPVLNMLDRVTRVLVEDGVALQVQHRATYSRNHDAQRRNQREAGHWKAFEDSKRARVPSGGRPLGTYTILYNNRYTPYQGWPGTWPEGGSYSHDATLEVSKYGNIDKIFHVFTANGDKYYTTEDFTIAQDQRWEINEVVDSRIWFMIDGKKIAFDKSEPPAP